MEVSGNNNTVYCSYTTSITTNNEHSFNNSSRNVQTGGCAIVIIVLGLALIGGVVGLVGLGVFEFWNFLLAWVM